MKNTLRHRLTFPLIRLLAFAPLALGAADGDLRWTARTGGVIFGPPAISPSGDVLVGSEDGGVHAFSPDGAPLWSFTGAADWIDSAPTIAPDGTVYAGSWDGFLYAIDGDTGSLRWKYETGGLIVASPAIGPDGTVYVGSNDTFLYAIHPDGTLKWITAAIASYDPINGSPVLSHGGTTIFFGNDAGELFALDAATGARRWGFSIQSVHPPASAAVSLAISSAPAIGRDGSVYFTSENGRLYALKSSGELLWSYQAAEPIRSSPAISSDGSIYFAAQDGYLYAVDTEGFQIWETFIGDVFYCSPALTADGDILIAGYAGSAQSGAASRFVMTSPEGVVLWEFLVEAYNDSSPNIAPDGSFYFGAHDGRLYQFAGSAPLMDGQWPRFQANTRQTGYTGETRPTDLAAWFPEISDLQDGWGRVAWFGDGWVRDAGLPWIEHSGHGYLYLGRAEATGLWFHHLSLAQWLFAPQAAPGYLFQPTANAWIYHPPAIPETGVRWYHDLRARAWFPDYPR
jgi:outer membrane protein assembly factor BamB